MGSAGVAVVRVVEPADHERLRELTVAAKLLWDYDPEVVRSWAGELTFEGDHERWVAEVDGVIVAWAGLSPPKDGVAVLPALWVDPAWLGRGLGTRLFRVAADRARELGATRLEWGSELGAVGFYEKVGGRVLRDHDGRWGRAPWMGLEL